jgi:capsular exopolysaccharide synthesis family protein
LSGRPMSTQEALGSASVKIIEQASIPFKPTGTDSKLIALAALFASIFMGIILAFLFEYMDQTIKSPTDVERVLGISLFGAIPIIRSIHRILINRNVKKMLVNRDLNRMPRRYNMVFENLANQLRLMMTAQSFKTVMVTSAGIQEGTSTVVANLGVYSAYGEAKKVLIIDANFYRPTMHKIFNVPNNPGFVDVLTKLATVEQAIKSVQPTLSILPAGKTTSNPLIFLDSPKTRETLEKLKNQFDLIIIDCADLNSTQEGSLLATYVDKTILVISENQSRRSVALRVLANLKEHKASILGAILNKRTYPIPKFVYNRV